MLWDRSKNHTSLSWIFTTSKSIKWMHLINLIPHSFYYTFWKLIQSKGFVFWRKDLCKSSQTPKTKLVDIRAWQLCPQRFQRVPLEKAFLGTHYLICPKFTFLTGMEKKIVRDRWKYVRCFWFFKSLNKTLLKSQREEKCTIKVGTECNLGGFYTKISCLTLDCSWMFQIPSKRTTPVILHVLGMSEHLGTFSWM